MQTVQGFGGVLNSGGQKGTEYSENSVAVGIVGAVGLSWDLTDYVLGLLSGKYENHGLIFPDRGAPFVSGEMTLSSTVKWEFTFVPEPSSGALMGFGLTALSLARRAADSSRRARHAAKDRSKELSSRCCRVDRVSS